MAEVRSSSGAPAAAAFGGIGAPSPGTPLIINSVNGDLYALIGGVSTRIVAAGASVSSIAETFTGGLISVAGSPITTSGTLALTVAGTSGGVVYFSGANTWASSGVLAADSLVKGGGAGAAPSTITTGTGVLTALGVAVGSAGAFVTFNGALGTPSSGVATNLTGTASGMSIGGNAATATALQTARNINGVSFNGTGDITVTAAAGTLSGATLAAGVTASSLTSLGTITALSAGTGEFSSTVLMGGGSLVSSAKVAITFAGASFNGLVINGTDATSGQIFAYFDLSGTPIGSISRNAATSAVLYNTTSDYRIKELFGPFADAQAMLSALTVHDGKFIGGEVRMPLLVAHEVQAVTPWAVTGTKDATDKDGTPVYQQLATGSHEALLIAGWQDHEARLNALRAEFDAYVAAHP